MAASPTKAQRSPRRHREDKRVDAAKMPDLVRRANARLSTLHRRRQRGRKGAWLAEVDDDRDAEALVIGPARAALDDDWLRVDACEAPALGVVDRLRGWLRGLPAPFWGSRFLGR